MNLQQMKYFKAIADFKSLTRAAEHLHISQPSLSIAVKELEAEFGVVLFRRYYRGILLTPQGEILFELCKDILTRVEQAEKAMKDLGEARAVLKVGVPPMIGTLILPKIYKDFLSAGQDFSLEISEGGTQDLLKKLTDDVLDMVFLTHNAPFDQRFSSLPVTQMEICCYTGKNHPLATQKYVTPALLDNIPIVLFENSFFQTESIKKWFANDGITPRIILQTSQFSTLSSMIDSNLAVGFMFSRLIGKEAGLISVPLQVPVSVGISLVWKKQAYPTRAMQAFHTFVKNSDLFGDKKPL